MGLAECLRWPKGDSMQEDLRGAESLYAVLPGFESQLRRYSPVSTGISVSGVPHGLE